MGIKEQVDFAKDELTQDEKLLAGLIKAERFYRKNRLAIIALAVILVAGAVGYAVMGYIKEQKLEAANVALLALEKNPDDSSALEQLKKNDPKLAELFLLRKAAASGDLKSLEELSKSGDEVVSDLASYHLGVWKEDGKMIENYRMRSGALLKDFALFDEAFMLMREGKVTEARERLSLIADDSQIGAVAEMLAHYGVTEKTEGGE
ncbi:hypothetical protein NNO_0707 [Hydrogenimonas sp.]|nr:hypothetical protein NNO_0707 [Hydrogenimonas sp.]